MFFNLGGDADIFAGENGGDPFGGPGALRNLMDRVDKMMKAGLLREVEELYNRGMKDAILAINVIGYNELIDYLDDRISLDSAITQIKQNTRRFAKRQITWFKGMKNIRYARSDKEVIDILRVLWKREK